jgi:hypothetical protein
MFIQPLPQSDISTTSAGMTAGPPRLSSLGGMAEAARREILMRVPRPSPRMVEPARRAAAWYDRC